MKDGSVLILDHKVLLPTLKSLEDQRLFSGLAHKEFLISQLSLQVPSLCLMKLLMLLPKVPLQSPEEVIPSLYLRKFQDQLTNSLMSVLEVVPLSSLSRVSNCQ